MSVYTKKLCTLTKNRFSFVLSFLFLMVGTACEGQAQEYQMTVTAGAFDRVETVVSFQFPDDVKAGVYRMDDESGGTVYLQVDESNRGWFILENLEAGTSKRYSFNGRAVSPRASGSGVSKYIDENTISFRTGDRDVLSYFHRDNEPPPQLDDRYKRGGYIHPVYSPGGVLLTNHLNPDLHPHHSGIWSAWTRTEFQGRTPDFWNPHANSGRVDQADSLEVAWEGPVHGGLKAQHYFVDISSRQAPVIALNEQWQVHVFNSSRHNEYHIFDLAVTQTVNTSQPLVLPEYHYGGVGFRGHIDWDDPDNVRFLTSEGLGRDGHATRARWAHIGGRSDGELAGIAILGHPENYRHPQPMRIHPEEPFFNYSPPQLGEMSIEPGSPYVARYRYVTYDGDPDPEQIDRLWNDYAYPPAVTVKPR